MYNFSFVNHIVLAVRNQIRRIYVVGASCQDAPTHTADTIFCTPTAHNEHVRTGHAVSLPVLIMFALMILLAACNSQSETTGPQLSGPLPTSPSQAASTLTEPELTATRFIADTTATAVFLAENPAAAPTETKAFLPLAVGTCVQGESNRFDGRLSGLIQTQIDDANLKDTVVGVIEVQNTDCEGTPTITEVLYIVNITVPNLNNETLLADLVANVLDVLSQFAPSHQNAALSIRFEQGDTQRTIETEYEHAVEQYGAGLTGAALIQALGGLQS